MHLVGAVQRQGSSFTIASATDISGLLEVAYPWATALFTTGLLPCLQGRTSQARRCSSPHRIHFAARSGPTALRVGRITAGTINAYFFPVQRSGCAAVRGAGSGFPVSFATDAAGMASSRNGPTIRASWSGHPVSATGSTRLDGQPYMRAGRARRRPNSRARS